MLKNASSVTPVEGGLGPGRYEAEVEATDEDEARAKVTTVLAGCDVTVEAVERVAEPESKLLKSGNVRDHEAALRREGNDPRGVGRSQLRPPP